MVWVRGRECGGRERGSDRVFRAVILWTSGARVSGVWLVARQRTAGCEPSEYA